MIHIGEKIKQRIEDLGMSKKVFADRINKTRNVVYDIFKRKSIDTAQLHLISKVLDYDFFQFYSKDLPRDVKKPVGLSGIMDEGAQYDVKSLKEEVQHLKEKNELLEKLNEALSENKK